MAEDSPFPELPDENTADPELRKQLENDKSGRVDDEVPEVSWNPADYPTNLNRGPE